MIVPGSVNPLLLAGGGDPLDEYGVIARSLRCRLSASGYLSRTPGAAGNKSTWTARIITKRGKLGAQQGLLGAKGASQDTIQVFFDTDDTLKIIGTGTGGGIGLAKYTSQVFRDPAATLDIVIGLDTTQATAGNRFSLEINGKAVTSFATSTDPGLNDVYPINGANIHVLGAVIGALGVFVYSDQVISFPCIVDGQKLPASSFGLFHPVTGQWRPKGKAAVKAVVDAGGICSTFPTFEDPTNLTTLCADASAKGNNWTANNISLTAGATYDSFIDTPTNNFCTLNPLIGYSSPPAFSDGNLTYLGGVSAFPTAFGTMGMRSGVWWFEVKMNTANVNIGIATAAAGPDTFVGADANGWAYASTGLKYTNGSGSAYGATFTSADTIGVKFDADAGSLEFFKQTNSTGAFVSQGVAYTGLTNGPYYPASGDGASGTQEGATFNFGQRPFNNGSLPTGAKALCTKNLPIPTNSAVAKPSSAFAAVVDTGANVQATLATARANFGANYIEIFKRIDGTAEGWRWRFSDDVANYLDTTSTAAKAAFPALSGTSYVAYAIKVAAANGVAMGRLVHTNGVADTVADGLGNTRKAVILKNEATGTWYFYHPDLTAGKLLYLEQATAETTDATLGTVLSNSFVVAAALASGTYRWIAFADLEGFLKLFKYTANNSPDGTCPPQGLTAAFTFLKRSSIGGSGKVYDLARSPSNVVSLGLALDSTAGNVSVAALDINSGNLKLRISGQDPNATGTEIGVSFGAFPFRYANAR